MRIEIAAGALSDALGRAGQVLKLERHINIPVLAAITLGAHADRVQVSATNLDQYIAVSAAALDALDGVVAVPGGRFAALIDGLPRAASVMLTAHPNHLEVRSGRSTYKLPRLPEYDVPEPLAVNEAACRVELTRDSALRLLGPAYVAADDERYYLRGIHLHSVAGRLAAVATNGHVLCRRIIDAPLPTDVPTITLPIEAVKPLVKLLKQCATDAAVSLA
jgi:DNA polymerase-3 subunit beta